MSSLTKKWAELENNQLPFFFRIELKERFKKYDNEIFWEIVNN